MLEFLTDLERAARQAKPNLDLIRSIGASLALDAETSEQRIAIDILLYSDGSNVAEAAAGVARAFKVGLSLEHDASS